MDKQQKKLLKRFARVAAFLSKDQYFCLEADAEGSWYLTYTKDKYFSVGWVPSVEMLTGTTDSIRAMLHAIGFDLQVQRIEFDAANGGYVMLPHWNVLWWKIKDDTGGDPVIEQLITQYDDPRHAAFEAFIVAVESKMKWYYKLLRM